MRIYGPNGANLASPSANTRRSSSTTFSLGDVSTATETRSAVPPRAAGSIDALLAMAATPDGQFELDWDGRRWLVVFRHHDPPAASFTPVYPFADCLFGEIRLLASNAT